VPCEVYQWTSGDQGNRAAFTVRFLSPDREPDIRRLFVEPLVWNWRGLNPGGAPGGFLDRACAEGYRVLTRYESHAPWQRDMYRIARALFQYRGAGHAHVGRRFNSAIDFADIRPGREPRIIVPVLCDADDSVTRRAGSPLALAQQLLGSVLGRPRGQGGTTVRFPEVRAAFESALRRRPASPTPTGGRQVFPVHALPGRGTIDLVFTGGLERAPGWDLTPVEEKVRSALICDPAAGADALSAEPDDAEILQAAKTIRTAVLGKRPSELRRWLKNVREHGYLPLIGLAQCRGDSRKLAAARAGRIANVLFWLSYKLMGRCFGALMLKAFSDLCEHATFSTSWEERWLFHQMHFPQLHLACLPLDFLGREQLRWIMPTLHDLWARGITEPEAYDAVADLLGYYGDLVRERRAADRQRKAEALWAASPGRSRRISQGSIAANGTSDISGTETLPRLHSPACPTCGTGLQLVKVIETYDQDKVRASFFCPKCDECDYLVNVAELARGRSTSG
jgi:hypothetical protein